MRSRRRQANPPPLPRRAGDIVKAVILAGGLGTRISAAHLAPFLANMHFALWCMSGLSVLGAVVALARPKHATSPTASGAGDSGLEPPKIAQGGQVVAA